MTTTIEQLREEARDTYYRKFSSISPSANNQFIDELITHVHNSAIRSALEVLPEERIIHGYMPSENIPENNAWNEYRLESIKALQSLLVNE